MTIFKDQNLVTVPVLILFDKSNLQMEESDLIEKLRARLESENYYFNTQYINFSDTKAIEEIYYGLDWLSSVMKPIIE